MDTFLIISGTALKLVALSVLLGWFVLCYFRIKKRIRLIIMKIKMILAQKLLVIQGWKLTKTRLER
jgi:hypothetical protein